MSRFGNWAKYRARLIRGASCSAVLFGAAAYAQDTTQAGAPSGEEEITVTAQRRAESIRRIPIAISAYSGAALGRANVDSVSKLEFIAPSITFSRQNGQALISVRGIGTTVLGAGGDPGVAVHIDGVYLARQQYHDAALFDVSRVEVLRGPQGTISGRNATGGAINIISNGPTDEVTGYANVTLGSFDAVQTNAAFSGPLASDDSILGRIAVRTNNNSGYTENVFRNEFYNGANQQSVRGQLLFRLSDRVELLLGADVDYINTNGYPFIKLGTIIGPRLPGILSADRDTYYRHRIVGTTARLTADFDGFRVTSITGYREFSENFSDDLDATSANLAYSEIFNPQQQLSQEVNIASDSEGPFSWLLGVYYLHERTEPDQAFFLPVVGLSLFLGGNISTDSYATFSQVSYRFSDAWALTAGLRYTYDRKELLEYRRINSGVPATKTGAKSWDAVTPKISLEFTPSEQTLYYVSISEGFRSGGFNVGNLQAPYDPEYVWNYEVGFKGQFFDRTLSVNLAAFHADYSDMQVFQIRNLAATVENAARATLNGVELELGWRPDNDVKVDVVFSYLDATFDTFLSVDSARPQLGLLDLSGNTLPRAPKFKFSVGAEKTWNVGPGELTVRGEYSWSDRIYFSEFNLENVSQAAVGIWNARISYIFPDGRLRVSAFAENIGDERVFSNMIVGAPVIGTPVLGFESPPRRFGVTFGVSY